jgi:hypothetical protein
MASAREAAADREAVKVRRQKIFVGIGGGILLVVVAFQALPAVFGSSGGSQASDSTAAPSVAVPIAPSAATGSGGSSSLVPHSIWKLANRDVFAPQISVPGAGGGLTAAGVFLKGPSVRAKGFVAKDVFIPQIQPPAASAASSGGSTPAEGQAEGVASPGETAGGGYIIVIDSIPGIGTTSEKAAARALVAARNAGLKDVVANDSVPGTTGQSPHFTVYTGPYQYESSAQTELARALRNGYPHALAQQLPGTSGKGF